MPDYLGEPIIRVRGLSPDSAPTQSSDGLDLDVFRGEVLAVVDASGSGKSVLLRTIIGLNRRSRAARNSRERNFTNGDIDRRRSSSGGECCFRMARSSAP